MPEATIYSEEDTRNVRLGPCDEDVTKTRMAEETKVIAKPACSHDFHCVDGPALIPVDDISSC